MKSFLIKSAVTVSLSAVSLYFCDLLLPLAVLLVCVTADYISGMVKAFMKSSLSSKTGVRGILKKLCYFVCVAVGVGVDFALKLLYAESAEGTVACLVCVWLIINELISILENLSEIGVPLPEFLIKLTKKLLINKK